MTSSAGGSRTKVGRLAGLLALPVLVAASFTACGDDSDDSDNGLLGGDPTEETTNDTGDTGDTGGDIGGDIGGDTGGDIGGDAGGDEAGEVEPPPSGEPELDGMAQDCQDGDMDACDELFRSSEEAVEYQIYADTCAGRQPVGTGAWCVDSFG